MSGLNISQSYATGDVTAGENAEVGGLIGSAGSGDIANSYSTGAVKGGDTSYVGSTVGELGLVQMEYTYALGHVSGSSGRSGGLVGRWNDYGLHADYWDTDTTGRSRRAGCGGDSGSCGRGAKGLKTETFQSGLPEGFDPAIWGEKPTINNGFPYLLANPPPK